MFGLVKVFGSVPVWRRVATADVTATKTQTQVDPGGADLQAVFTTIGTGSYVFNLIEMSTFRIHFE